MADDLAEQGFDEPVGGQVEEATDADESATAASERTKRDEDISDRPEIAEKLDKILSSVEKGFADQRERSDQLRDNWDAYNCVLGRYQNYTGGISNLFLPFVRDAVNALTTRYVNQSFPNSARHIEVVTDEEDQPYALLSLLEHYVSKRMLRTNAAPALLVNGQIEGQYNAYVDWGKVTRFTVSRSTEPIQAAGLQFQELGEVETITEEEVDDEAPDLEVLHDSDVLVLPQTAPTIEAALEMGGSVTVVRRWTKDTIRGKIDDGDIDEELGEQLLVQMGGESGNTVDFAKKLADEAGIHISGKSTFALIYETWSKLKVDGKRRLCRAYFAGDAKVLGCKLCPWWCDRCPVLSGPVEKVPGLFKGEPPVKFCLDMQYWANDMANEAAHSMFFTLAPIVTADPVKVSKWKELVTDVGAVWPVEKDGIQMFEWPNKAREAMEIISACKSAIFENLGVSPGMLPQQSGRPGQKRNQAEVALEQQVELLQTADAVTNFEGQILTPTMQRWAEYDHQFRTKEILVREYGDMGLQAAMEEIGPTNFSNRWEIRWSGVEAARNAANLQQQIGWVGTVIKTPPNLYQGYKLNLAPLFEWSAGQVFAPRLARLIFVSMKDEMSVDPKVENDMMVAGFEARTHAADNDAQHLQVHMQIPPSPQRDNHIRMHQQAMQLKQQAMAAQGQQQGPPQIAGKGPRAGAMPAQGPKRPQQPAGAIHPDQMARAGVALLPRRV